MAIFPFDVLLSLLYTVSKRAGRRMGRRASRWSTRRTLLGTQRRPIGEVVDGERVRIVGVARPATDRLLAAPLTGRPCVWWQIAVDNEYGDSLPTELGSDASREPFLVEDGRGDLAYVEPDEAEHQLTSGLVSLPASAFDADVFTRALRERFQTRYSMYTHETVPGYGFREAILAVGDRLAVVGAGTREPDPDPGNVRSGYRDGPRMRLRMNATRRYPVILSTDVTVMDAP